VIDAAGGVGRQRERDQLLLMMMYRHGLRVSEAVDLRWTDFDLDASRDRPFWVRRRKGSKEPDTVRLLQRAKKRADGIYVFRSERGGKLSTDSKRSPRNPPQHRSRRYLHRSNVATAIAQSVRARRRRIG